jgi:CheY-like chemotaxis protein
MMMPMIWGEELIKRLRQREEFVNLPIVVLTAYPDAFGEAARAAGATEILQKPEGLAHLVETVNRLLGQDGK